MVPNNARLLVVVTLVATAVSSVIAQGKNEGDSYRDLLKARASKAEKSKDVKALVECAFALYPLEVAAKTKKPRYKSLLGQAADAVLAKEDAEKAKEFVELAGPLTACLPKEKQKQLTNLAIGKPVEQVLKVEAERARGPVKKAGKDLFDPEVKTRGGDRDLAEKLGKAFVIAAHPTAQDPGVLRYSISASGGRVKVIIRMEWFGAVLGTHYYSDVEVELGRVGGSVKITDWDYEDQNAIFSANQANIRRLVRRFND